MDRSLYLSNGTASRVADESQRPATRELTTVIALLVAHMPLAILLYRVPLLGVVHALVVLVVGMRWALNPRYPLYRVAMAAGYLAGVEVLWRMAEAPVFWEIGKYGCALLMVTSLVVRRKLTIPTFPLAYFLALVPSCFITLGSEDLITARGDLSFNMSGPLALVISCWFFSHFKLTSAGLLRILYSIFVPVGGIAFATLFFTLTIQNIQFSTESNLATSGGFGPNQVSAVLGLGVFVTAGCLILYRPSGTLRIVLGFLALFFAAQSVMTFSRGGMYNALGALIALTAFHFRNFADGIKRVVPIVIAGLIFLYLIFPVLNQFTGGKLADRFAETSTTNRSEIVESDFEMFQENPVLGVGVGAAKTYRKKFIDFAAASHTEFSRLISEHGSLGLLAAICLLCMTVSNVLRQSSLLGRALCAGAAVWCMLFMLNAGMRIAAPSFMWGLTFITLRPVVNGARTSRRKIKSKWRPAGLQENERVAQA